MENHQNVNVIVRFMVYGFILLWDNKLKPFSRKDFLSYHLALLFLYSGFQKLYKLRGDKLLYKVGFNCYFLEMGLQHNSRYT